jgi:phytoene dehydrogenase-like protein
LLKGKYVDDRIENGYKNMKLNTSRIQVALGVNRTFEAVPHKIKYVLDKPLMMIDGDQYNSIDVHVFNRVSTLAPQGKTLLMVQFETRNDEYWSKLRQDNMGKYRQAKDKVAQDVIDILENKLGRIRELVEMIDVTTPATYIRYTGTWKGSIQGWSNEKLFERNPFKKTLPGLSNFYMTGQWVEPGGGVPTVFKSGRDLAQIICKKDGKNFKTS